MLLPNVSLHPVGSQLRSGSEIVSSMVLGDYDVNSEEEICIFTSLSRLQLGKWKEFLGRLSKYCASLGLKAHFSHHIWHRERHSNANAWNEHLGLEAWSLQPFSKQECRKESDNNFVKLLLFYSKRILLVPFEIFDNLQKSYKGL